MSHLWSKSKSLRHDAWWLYFSSWRNFKTDNWKSKRTLRQEIGDVLSHGSFNKTDLIQIKDLVKSLGFKEFLKP